MTQTQTNPDSGLGAPPESEPHEPDVEDAEPGDEPEPDEPTPDEPEPEGFNERRFEAEQRRHERETRKVFGAAFDAMEACATCGGVGFTPRDLTPAPELRADESLVVCPDCNGYGQRQTPSLDERYMLIPCTGCQGHGYRERSQLEAEAQARAYQAQVTAAPPPIPPTPVWDATQGRYVLPADGGSSSAALPSAYPSA